MAAPQIIGRYLLFGEIASGGMGAVHLGRLAGAGGFSRTVAIKRIHPHLATNDEIATMFLDEARLASRIHHPNVVPIVDAVQHGNELALVMEFIHGEPLSRLVRWAGRERQPPPLPVVAAIVTGALHGLHAAHEACGEDGRPLGLVHRDISPQNILVGVDGVARVVDFGIAKASQRATMTSDGVLKGKLGYMAPEQIAQASVDRRADLFAMGVVLWEALVGRRLFSSEDQGDLIQQILAASVAPPSSQRAGVSAALDAVALRALAREPRERFQTAREMAEQLEKAIPLATQREVGEWVGRVARQSLGEMANRLAEIETNRLHLPPGDGQEAPLLPPASSPPLPTEGTQTTTHGVARAALPSRPDESSRRTTALTVASIVAGLLVSAAVLRWPDDPAKSRSAATEATAPRPSASEVPVVAPPETSVVTTMPSSSSVHPTGTTTRKPAPPRSAAPPAASAPPAPTMPSICQTNPILVNREGLSEVRPECRTAR